MNYNYWPKIKLLYFLKRVPRSQRVFLEIFLRVKESKPRSGENESRLERISLFSIDQARTLDNNDLNQVVVFSGFSENKALGAGCSVSRAHKTWSRSLLGMDH